MFTAMHLLEWQKRKHFLKINHALDIWPSNPTLQWLITQEKWKLIFTQTTVWYDYMVLLIVTENWKQTNWNTHLSTGE